MYNFTNIVCFGVYDFNERKSISKDEIFQLLKSCLVKGSEEDEDGVKDLVDMVLKKLDEDRDGRVSEVDWQSAVLKENLLLEALGQCLPSTLATLKYLGVENDDETMNFFIKTSNKNSALKGR